MVIVPRMLAKTAYDWPFEICEMDDPRPKMVLCTAGVAFEDADAEHIGLTAYLKAYDAAQAESSVPVASEVKAVPQSEVEDKAVAGPSEVKAEKPPTAEQPQPTATARRSRRKSRPTLSALGSISRQRRGVSEGGDAREHIR